MATNLANISIKDSKEWNTYLDLIYPIGSLYFSTSEASPASSFGGSWVQITDTFLVSAGETYELNSTGGKSSISHDHNAAGWLSASITPNQGGSGRTYYRTQGTDYYSNWSTSASGIQSANRHMVEGVAVVGRVEPSSINIVPPYLAINVYKRTA